MSLPNQINSGDWSASQIFLDEFSLRLHQAVAERLRRNPSGILQTARENLRRWLAAQGDDVAALLEWKNLLETVAPEKLARIITQKTDEGQRLRSSSPFAGVLSDAERETIWRKCAEGEFV